MATLYVGGRLFDGEKVQDGQAVLEEGGRIKRVAPVGEFKGFAGQRVDTSGGTLIPGRSPRTTRGSGRQRTAGDVERDVKTAIHASEMAAQTVAHALARPAAHTAVARVT